MHTRTIAAALMAALEEAMDGPDDIPNIVGTDESGDIAELAGIHNEGSFTLTMSDGSTFRVDVVRVGSAWLPESKAAAMEAARTDPETTGEWDEIDWRSGGDGKVYE